MRVVLTLALILLLAIPMTTITATATTGEEEYIVRLPAQKHYTPITLDKMNETKTISFTIPPSYVAHLKATVQADCGGRYPEVHAFLSATLSYGDKVEEHQREVVLGGSLGAPMSKTVEIAFIRPNGTEVNVTLSTKWYTGSGIACTVTVTPFVEVVTDVKEHIVYDFDTKNATITLYSEHFEKIYDIRLFFKPGPPKWISNGTAVTIDITNYVLKPVLPEPEDYYLEYWRWYLARYKYHLIYYKHYVTFVDSSYTYYIIRPTNFSVPAVKVIESNMPIPSSGIMEFNIGDTFEAKMLINHTDYHSFEVEVKPYSSMIVDVPINIVVPVYVNVRFEKAKLEIVFDYAENVTYNGIALYVDDSDVVLRVEDWEKRFPLYAGFVDIKGGEEYPNPSAVSFAVVPLGAPKLIISNLTAGEGTLDIVLTDSVHKFTVYDGSLAKIVVIHVDGPSIEEMIGGFLVHFSDGHWPMIVLTDRMVRDSLRKQVFEPIDGRVVLLPVYHVEWGEAPSANVEFTCKVHVRVVDENGNPVHAHVKIYDRSGNLVAEFEGDEKTVQLFMGRYTVVATVGNTSYTKTVDIAGDATVIVQTVFKAMVESVWMKVPEKVGPYKPFNVTVGVKLASPAPLTFSVKGTLYVDEWIKEVVIPVKENATEGETTVRVEGLPPGTHTLKFVVEDKIAETTITVEEVTTPAIPTAVVIIVAAVAAIVAVVATATVLRRRREISI